MEERELREELARMDADLAALEARLADHGYTERTPQALVDTDWTWRNELRAQIEARREQLANQAAPIPGGLPPEAVGRWAPLALFEHARAEEESTELPTPELAVIEAEAPDREAISAEVTAELQKKWPNVRRLIQLAKRWRRDPQTLRVLVAALRTARSHQIADQLGGKPPVVVARDTWVPPTAWLTQATEAPDEVDGLTVTQRLVLQSMRVAAPPGRAWIRVSEIAAEVSLRAPACDLALVERALISLGHPSLRRIPLIEMQGFTGRFTPPDTHLTHARLTREAVEVLDEALPVPLLLVNGAEGLNSWFPPHSPRELLQACLVLLTTADARIYDKVEAPDFPDGGVLLYGGIMNLWRGGEGTLHSRARISVEVNGPTARIVMDQFPWPLNAAFVHSELGALRPTKALDGVTSIVDQSSASGGKLLLELEHLAFSGPVRDAILKSCVCQCSFKAALFVEAGGKPRRVDLSDLLNVFLAQRREVAVKKLDRAVAQARTRAQTAEAVYVALQLLEPVQQVMREADDDAQAIAGLMRFMTPEHRKVLPTLPFPASHRYQTGFTEAQARHLLSVRKLASRRADSAQHDWATLLSEADEAAKLLNEREAILDIVRKELRGALERFGDQRRTALVRS